MFSNFPSVARIFSGQRRGKKPSSISPKLHARVRPLPRPPARLNFFPAAFTFNRGIPQPVVNTEKLRFITYGALGGFLRPDKKLVNGVARAPGSRLGSGSIFLREPVLYYGFVASKPKRSLARAGRPGQPRGTLCGQASGEIYERPRRLLRPRGTPPTRDSLISTFHSTRVSHVTRANHRLSPSSNFLRRKP